MCVVWRSVSPLIQNHGTPNACGHISEQSCKTPFTDLGFCILNSYCPPWDGLWIWNCVCCMCLLMAITTPLFPNRVTRASWESRAPLVWWWVLMCWFHSIDNFRAAWCMGSFRAGKKFLWAIKKKLSSLMLPVGNRNLGEPKFLCCVETVDCKTFSHMWDISCHAKHNCFILLATWPWAIPVYPVPAHSCDEGWLEILSPPPRGAYGRPERLWLCLVAVKHTKVSTWGLQNRASCPI